MQRMRALMLGLFLAGCSNTSIDPDALARGRACTSEGMWCQDANHSRCCRGLKCEDSKCVRHESKKDDKESL